MSAFYIVLVWASNFLRTLPFFRLDRKALSLFRSNSLPWVELPVIYICLSPLPKLYLDLCDVELSKLLLLNRWQWNLGKALWYGWNRQFYSCSLTLAQFVSGLCVLPDLGSFYLLWAFMLFGQGNFPGDRSNLFMAWDGRLSLYSPCAECTFYLQLTKTINQVYKIIMTRAQGWVIPLASLSLE